MIVMTWLVYRLWVPVTARLSAYKKSWRGSWFAWTHG